MMPIRTVWKPKFPIKENGRYRSSKKSQSLLRILLIQGRRLTSRCQHLFTQFSSNAAMSSPVQSEKQRWPQKFSLQAKLQTKEIQPLLLLPKANRKKSVGAIKHLPYKTTKILGYQRRTKSIMVIAAPGRSLHTKISIKSSAPAKRRDNGFHDQTRNKEGWKKIDSLRGKVVSAKKLTWPISNWSFKRWMLKIFACGQSTKTYEKNKRFKLLARLQFGSSWSRETS